MDSFPRRPKVSISVKEGPRATVFEGNGARKSVQVNKPWWTQLDGFPMASEEDIMDQFIQSAEMFRLERMILEKFNLDAEHLEHMGSLRPEDAKEIIASHDAASEFLRHRHLLEEKIEARDALSQRLRQKKTAMGIEAMEEGGEGEDDGDEKAKNEEEEQDDEPRSPKVKKSVMVHGVKDTSEAGMLVMQRMGKGANRRRSSIVADRRSSTVGARRSSSARRTSTMSQRSRLQQLASNVLTGQQVVRKFSLGLGRKNSSTRMEEFNALQGASAGASGSDSFQLNSVRSVGAGTRADPAAHRGSLIQSGSQTAR